MRDEEVNNDVYLNIKILKKIKNLFIEVKKIQDSVLKSCDSRDIVVSDIFVKVPPRPSEILC